MTVSTQAEAARRRQQAITAVRWILGTQCFLSGINWWFKILPFPNIHDPLILPMKSEIVATMIKSGWMFTAAKVVEVATGVSLLTNRYSVVMMVVAFPVLMMTFLLDAIPFFTFIPRFLAGELSGANLFAGFLDMVFFGGAVLLMQIYLMVEWIGHYRPLLVARYGDPEPQWQCACLRGPVLVAVRWAAIVIGLISTLWMVGMVQQWLVPWRSLALLAQHAG